jgi:hypothetical protein
VTPDPDYVVVLLIERELTEFDARQVVALHESVPQSVRYRVLLPADDAARRVQGAVGSMASDDRDDRSRSPSGSASPDADSAAQQAVDRSVAVLQAAGRPAAGRATGDDPVDALAEEVRASSAAEAIVLTAPHAVRELLHVDWASRARRVLGIPTLHLLEHETFDEQAGGGEGVSGV